MEKRSFGKTGLSVTVLGYGAMELRSLDEKDAARICNAVLDSGINYIDTSPDYGPSEYYIGKAIAHRRDEYFLASKCGCNIDEHGRGQTPPHIWTRARLLENLETSLRLLHTDHLDVWQLHGTTPGELAGGREDEVIRTMQELKQQGKVRFIGISFRNGGPKEEGYPAGFGFNHLPHFLEYGVFDMIQIVYGGLTRLSEAAISRAAQQGLGVVARGVVKQYFENYPDLFRQAGLEELLEPGETMNDFLIRYAASHPGISAMIIGTKSLDHLQQNVRAAEKGKLTPEKYEEAKRRLDSVGITPEKV